ncbi:CarD family transcriptional regulator [[Clostridium] cellulosi]|jgi:Cyclic nucleotide-binding domain./Bacterial regulatory proteins, crp family.|uniref:CarD family transcriptional regulator n=1 Tax=[Clostridium] cellulosi TaxID=29343 RepID=A0A078KQ79_9FIRM|nr:MAG: Crp/Fnr family transcriptional regulator [[Clostridium] cellulosi]CDZ24583.1 CarD family transcriptional regulator [[Clostridium] cellulosi]
MLSDNDIRYLREHLPFLKDTEIERIESASNEHYPKGSIILSGKNECKGLAFVKSGCLRAFFETADGKEITLFRLMPGDVCLLTASCILHNITFEIILEAEKDSTVMTIPAAAWEQIAKNNSEARNFEVSLMSKRFSEVMWVVEQLVSKNVGQRIAGFLLRQSELTKSESLSVTHEMIAKNLGTAREVVSRLLKYFENDGAVRLERGRIVITDFAKLQRLSE